MPAEIDTAVAEPDLPASFGDPSLRSWQRRALAAAAGWRTGPFLIAAAPGAGKTRPAVVLAKELLRRGEIDRVAIVCPTAPLTQQWASAAARVGPQPAAGCHPPAHDRGFPGRRRDLRPRRVIGGHVFAGVHGADPRDRRRGPSPRRRARLGRGLHEGPRERRAARCCSPGHRSAATTRRFPGISYDGDGFALPDVSYSYAEAIHDGACRRMVFVPFDGTLVWKSGDRTIESSFEEELSTRERGRRYRTAISTDLPEGLPRILAPGRRPAHPGSRLRPPRRRRARRRLEQRPRPGRRRIARRNLRRVADDRPPPGRRRPRAPPQVRRGHRPLDRRGQHGLRGRRHPAAAGRRLRDHGEDADDLPPDRRPLRPDRQRLRRRQLAVPARRAGPPRPRRQDRGRAPPLRPAPGRRRGPALGRAGGDGCRPSRATTSPTSSRWRPTSSRR